MGARRLADGERPLISTRPFRWWAPALALASCGAPPPPALPPPPPPPPVAELRVLPAAAVDGRPWLAAGAAVATAAGAGPLRMLGAEVVTEGERIGGFVEIPEGECLLAFTHPSPTLTDVDLFAYEDDGSVFAADESPDPKAAILACPPHPRRLYVMARAMSGSGVLAIGVHAVPVSAADAVAKAVRARGRPGEDSGRLDAWPGLTAKIRAHRDALGGRWEDLRHAVLPASPRAPSRLSAAVEAGRCLDVLVVPSDEVGSLEVVAEDEGARIVARARDQGRDRSVIVCAAITASVTVALRPRATQGLAAVIVGRSAPGGEAEIADPSRVVHLSQTLDLDAARRALSSRLSPGAPAPTTVSTGTARLGSRRSAPLDLPAGCARLDVIAGKPLVEIAASIWDDRGSLLAEGRAGAVLPLFACGRGGRARLDLEAVESPGPFAVELRRSPAAPPLLVAHPLAAGRLLARLDAVDVGRALADAGAAAGAALVALDEAQVRSLPLPAGQCTEVIVALDAGAGGVDLRLADGTGEGTVTRGRHVVSDRTCPPSGGTPAAELRALSGKGEALVLMRSVAP